MLINLALHSFVFLCNSQLVYFEHKLILRYTEPLQSPSDLDATNLDVASLDEDNMTITTKDLVCYSFQVARGMHYLTSQKVSS